MMCICLWNRLWKQSFLFYLLFSKKWFFIFLTIHICFTIFEAPWRRISEILSSLWSDLMSLLFLLSEKQPFLIFFILCHITRKVLILTLSMLIVLLTHLVFKAPCMNVWWKLIPQENCHESPKRVGDWGTWLPIELSSVHSWGWTDKNQAWIQGRFQFIF